MLTKDQEILSLSEINADLELAKEKLVTLLRAHLPERNRSAIAELERKIAEKEKSLHELNSLDQALALKLPAVINQQRGPRETPQKYSSS